MNSFDAVQSTMIVSLIFSSHLRAVHQISIRSYSSKVLNESCKEHPTAPQCTSGRLLADTFSGRTFDLPLQQGIITTSGSRVLFIDLQYYDSVKFSFEVASPCLSAPSCSIMRVSCCKKFGPYCRPG